MSSFEVRYTSTNLAELTHCYQCKNPFRQGELRTHLIHLNIINQNNNNNDQSVISVDQPVIILHEPSCVEIYRNAETLQLYQHILSPLNRHNRPNQLSVLHTWMQTKYQKYLMLAEHYPKSILTAGTISGSSYSMEWPIHPPTVINSELFSLEDFIGFFTLVFVDHITLDGEDAYRFIGEFKKTLQSVKFSGAATLKKGVCDWLWIHQVTGTNNQFRLISVIRPSETELIQAYNKRHQLIKHWQDLEDSKQQHQSSINKEWINLRDQFVRSIGEHHSIIVSLIDTVAKSLKLQSRLSADDFQCHSVNTVESTPNTHRMRYSYNCYTLSAANVSNFYILPHPDSNLSTLFCYSSIHSSAVADPIPFYYHDTEQITREIETRQQKQQLTKLLLTNLQQLCVHYPRSSVKAI